MFEDPPPVKRSYEEDLARVLIHGRGLRQVDERLPFEVRERARLRDVGAHATACHADWLRWREMYESLLAEPKATRDEAWDRAADRIEDSMNHAAFRLDEALSHVRCPVPDWPGGWMILVEEDQEQGEVVCDTRIEGPGDYRDAWPSRALAAAALAERFPGGRGASVAWVPAHQPEKFEFVAFTEAYWAEHGAPAVAAIDHFGTHVWPQERLLHVLALPNGPVRDVAAAYRSRLEYSDSGLAWIDTERLHATIWSAHQCPDIDAERFIAALGYQLRQVEPADVVVGPGVINAEGPQLDVYPDEPVAALVSAAYAAAAMVDTSQPMPDGPGWRPRRFWRPHVSLAYSRERHVMDLTGINHVRRRAGWRIDSLAVVSMTRSRLGDSFDGYSWDVLAVLPVGAGDANDMAEPA